VLSEKLITKIESIQRRATKMVFEIRSLSYEGRLNAMGLTIPELRRKRMDLIQTYKIIYEMDQWRTYHRTKGSVSPQIFEKKVLFLSIEQS